MTAWRRIDLCNLVDGDTYFVLSDGIVKEMTARGGAINGATHVLVDDKMFPVELPYGIRDPRTVEAKQPIWRPEEMRRRG